MSYVEYLGFTVLEVAPERTRIAVTVNEHGLNMHGGAHGGLIFSLADEAFGLISNISAQAVSAETHLSFFKAAQLGDRLVAIASPERVGRTLATYRVEVRLQAAEDAEAGELLALFLGTVSRREKPAK